MTDIQAPILSKKDFESDQSVRWCPWCGDYAILAQTQKNMPTFGRKREEFVFVSGIGCSSRFPYYMNTYGFHSIHGRAPAVATGVKIANPDLSVWVVTGDGDGLSIGGNHFMHVLRRNMDVNILMFNNRIYGLTKGQFSVTADEGQNLKYYGKNDLPPLDLCLEAIVADCGFVARSFAGDPKQVRPLLKAAISYDGAALLDIISPCVAFNNTSDSTKGYDWVKEHDDPLHDITYIPIQEEITTQYDPGNTSTVTLHDGSQILLRKLDESYDPTDKLGAIQALHSANNEESLLTGLIYYDPNRPNLIQSENLVESPLVQLTTDALRPNEESLSQIMSKL